MQGVYKLNFDCGRNGELKGLFVADSKEVKWLIESELQIYFGEVLGKHSEVCGKIEKGEITLVSKDANVVKVVLDHDLSNGFNPFHYSISQSSNLKELLGDKFEDDLTPRDVYRLLNEK